MTLWQSLQLISPAQWLYAAGLVTLFSWRGPSFTAWVLLADFIALLLIAAAMDFGLLVREPGNDQATAAMVVVWVASAAILVTQPGLPRALGAIGAVSILIFAALVYFGVNIATTSAIVNLMGFLQIAVAGIAGGSGNDSGGSGRSNHVPVSVVVQGRDYSLGQMADAAGYDPISQNRR